MRRERFVTIYKELEKSSDVEKLHNRYGYSKELLTVILTQKIVRTTKKRYHSVDKKQLLQKWRKGSSFLELSREINFAPLMTASLILQEHGLSRKQVCRYVKDHDSVVNKRIREELKKALEEDMIYSPEGNRIMRERGQVLEDRLQRILDKKRVKYITEAEAKKREHTKTPDFLLEKPLHRRGHTINWIECKASFGDEVEVKRDHKKQLQHYVELFGPGMTVYWYGFLNELKEEYKDILLSSRKNLYKILR